jgi:hypothetical protein
MMEENTFPIPNTGRTQITLGDEDTFSVECTGIDTDDHKRLVGFFGQMHGRFGEFRFEYAGVLHPKCRFDSDSVTFAQNGADVHDLAFPIKILPN